MARLLGDVLRDKSREVKYESSCHANKVAKDILEKITITDDLPDKLYKAAAKGKTSYDINLSCYVRSGRFFFLKAHPIGTTSALVSELTDWCKRNGIYGQYREKYEDFYISGYLFRIAW